MDQLFAKAVLRIGALVCVAAAALAVPGARADETSAENTATTTRATLIEPPASWASCDWDPGTDDRLAQCAFVSAPLNYARPATGRIRLLVKRRLANGPERAVIWLVHGGPGASATADMVDLSFGIPAQRDDISFYAVDHRGVGGSDRLSCPAQESRSSLGGPLIIGEEWTECIAAIRADEGARLEHLSTTGAAHDLDALISAFRSDDVPVFVYGASYGTYHVRRYLSLTDAPPDGVILEGLVAADGGMAGYDARVEATALRFLDTCDAAPACARHFTAPLRAETQSMLQALESGHCARLNLAPAVARQLLAVMTFFAETRGLVPPLVHRIRRCDPRDVRFVAELTERLADTTRGTDQAPLLHYHVVLSEMFRPDRPLAALQAQFAAATLSTGMEMTYAGLFPFWPRYEPSQHGVDDGSRYEGPLLILQGGLDPASPPAEALEAAAAFSAPGQHTVVFPNGAHGVTGATPTVAGMDCALALYLAFVDAPERRPDTRCVDTIVPLDWQTLPAQAKAFAGSEAIWDG